MPALALLVPALAVQAPPPGCTAPEARQFDFWAGEWDVYDASGKQLLGTSRVERILDGCALQEHWKGAKGGNGTSLNFYVPARKVWHQTWIANGPNSALFIEGGLVDGRMVLADAERQNRITYTPEGPDQLRQVWEVSKDGGKTWSVSFSGLYKRRR